MRAPSCPRHWGVVRRRKCHRPCTWGPPVTTSTRGSASRRRCGTARDAGGEITPLILDVTDAQQISAAADTVAVSMQVGKDGPTGLVNNAGSALAGR
jgi:hypothetical protein